MHLEEGPAPNLPFEVQGPSTCSLRISSAHCLQPCLHFVARPKDKDGQDGGASSNPGQIQGGELYTGCAFGSKSFCLANFDPASFITSCARESLAGEA